MEKNILAFDLGASSGRAILGTYNGETLTIQEIHRFINEPVTLNGTMYWDVLRLFHEIKNSLIKAKKYGEIDSIGVDTWGVDFGLLDKNGKMLENPVHYRDRRTVGMIDESLQKIDHERFYNITGNQFMEINTAFQLLSLQKNRPEILERTASLLMMPDLFNYFLTGIKSNEYSIASTTQLMDAHQRCWSRELLEKLDIPESIFQNIIETGTPIGPLCSEICEELDMKPAQVIAVAGHDTQCAMVATPALEDDFIFLSCGTWSLFGTELESPLINKKSEHYNLTNEGGYSNKASFLKNIIGLWLVQESRRQWIREGKEYDFTTLEGMAQTAKPFYTFIDPDATEFIPSGNIPGRMREFCKRTKQSLPFTEAEIVRCIHESLAFKYRLALEELKECTGKEYKNIYMLGGGVQSKLLCQFTANACNCDVTAGPIEATVYGNMAIQLMATGDIATLKAARKLIASSTPLTIYHPQDIDEWNEAFLRFQNIV